jgi:Ca2+-dependent lipid-binding protein
VFLSTRSFVKELYSGHLKITLESASDLPGKSLTGTSDPYVVFTVGDSTVRSKTMWR